MDEDEKEGREEVCVCVGEAIKWRSKRNTLETTIKAIKWSHPDHGGQC